MKRILVFCVVMIAVLGCGKDNFKTEPTVEIKSLSPEEVVKGQFFTLRAVITDKEGDVQDSVLIVRKRFSGTTQLGRADTLRYSIKDFGTPVKDKIEISAVFSYGELRDNYIFQNTESNTDKNLIVGMVVTDKAGHRSNYAESSMIVLKKL